MDSWHEILNKAIKAKSKADFQPSTSVQKMDASYLKGRGPDKKKKKFNPQKNSKVADNQLLTISETTIRASCKNLQKNSGSFGNWQLGWAAVGTPATDLNLVNISPNNSDGC